MPCLASFPEHIQARKKSLLLMDLEMNNVSMYALWEEEFCAFNWYFI